MSQPEKRSPLVSVGLPVCNGELYLEDAIRSTLKQTYQNLELIICDNASTDRTEEISRRFEAQDARVRYIRNGTNQGVAPNFNHAVTLARGRYFRWIAADDLLAPECIEKCLAALEANHELLLCHSQVTFIDESSIPSRYFDYPPGYAASNEPPARFRDTLRHDRLGYDIFGLIRTDALRTHLLGAYSGSDRVLRAELALSGRFHILPERLFLNRDHPESSVRKYPAHHLREHWYNPFFSAPRAFPHWRILLEYGRLVYRARISLRHRIQCWLSLTGWVMADLNWARLGADVIIAYFPRSWPWMEAFARSNHRRMQRRPKESQA